MKKWINIALFVAVMSSVTACGSGTKNVDKTAAISTNPSASGDTVNNGQPITLQFLFHSGHKAIMPIYKEIIEKKFPNVTIEPILADQTKHLYITDFVAGGNVPDLISWPFGSIEELKKLQVMSDLTPLVKKHNFDLNRLVPGVIDAVKSFGDNGEILFMPYLLNNNALFYNKDIFDKFTVPYPKDNMTWEEIYDLSKRFSRKENNIQYIGFLYSDLNLIYKNQMNLPLVDPKTNKTLINSDGWKKWIEIMGGFHKLPGSLYTPYNEKDYFIKDRRLAMRAGGNIMTDLAVVPDLNWDVVDFPHFSGYEPGSQINVQYFVVSSTGTHKDAAFQVMAYLLSDEVQTIMSRKGQIPVVQNKTAINEFGKEVNGTSNKNLKAFFNDKIAKPISWTPYDYLAKYGLQEALKQYGTTSKDLNTVMREAEENINKSIESERNK